MSKRTLFLPDVLNTKNFFHCVIILVLVIASVRLTSASIPRITDEQLLKAEQSLAGLGYWVLNIDGKVDASTRHAITAFQKVEDRKRTGILNGGVLEALRFASRPLPRFSTGRAHVEIDNTRQVLFLTDDQGIVVRILPVSTGTEEQYFDQGKWQIAHTPRGSFRIQKKMNGIRHASLGDLYYPNYFYGGVAIHGSLSVPPTPASHGCVRIPHFADKTFSSLVWVGMEVLYMASSTLTRVVPEESRNRDGRRLYENETVS